MPGFHQRLVGLVRAEIPAPALKKAIAAVFAKRKRRGGGTVLEWLRIAPGKHSPTGLHALTKKVSFLKELSVHRWSLAGITNARMRPYSQAVLGRPPFDRQRLSDETMALEIACFLRTTLLELTDNAVYMAGRRRCDLVRSAVSRVQGRQIAPRQRTARGTRTGSLSCCTPTARPMCRRSLN